MKTRRGASRRTASITLTLETKRSSAASRSMSVRMHSEGPGPVSRRWSRHTHTHSRWFGGTSPFFWPFCSEAEWNVTFCVFPQSAAFVPDLFSSFICPSFSITLALIFACYRGFVRTRWRSLFLVWLTEESQQSGIRQFVDNRNEDEGVAQRGTAAAAAASALGDNLLGSRFMMQIC